MRYKALKKRIEERATKAEQASLFATGGFKKALREDIMSINDFWLEKEAALLAQRADAHADEHVAAVSQVLRWLTLNYLAVLKIAKKHDKRCGSTLLEPMSMVLMSQSFVRGLTSSPLFADLGAVAQASSDGEPMLSSSREYQGADSGASPQAMIVKLLGPNSAHYFPHAVLERFAACKLMRTAASDLDSFAESDDESRGLRDRRERESHEREESLYRVDTVLGLTRGEASVWLGALFASMSVLCLSVYGAGPPETQTGAR